MKEVEIVVETEGTEIDHTVGINHKIVMKKIGPITETGHTAEIGHTVEIGHIVEIGHKVTTIKMTTEMSVEMIIRRKIIGISKT